MHGAWQNDAIGAIFVASLNMTRQPGMKTVAEGPKDREDRDFLKASGCELAQGDFIATPMPGSEVPGWISAGETSRQNLVKLIRYKIPDNLSGITLFELIPNRWRQNMLKTAVTFVSKVH